MSLSFEQCYRAIERRDARLDGVFFVAVTSTRIFCRPVCPAITPKRANCCFYPTAATAMAAGFRPCLRCRPESAPDSPAWNGTMTTVTRALRLIEAGALDTQPIEQFADRLGVGARHLRRLFMRHVGASPLSVARNRRALRARHLITESDRPMTEIAYAAGFTSIRQFNQTFHQLFACSPSRLRTSSRGKI